MILMNDFKKDPEELLQKQLNAAKNVFESGWYVLGKHVEAFETAWAQENNVSQCIGVGNGMDALEIGLRASDIGPGDEVITTSLSAFASTLAIFRAGATPVFADISPETGLLDMESVQQQITPKTKGILLVHLYGQAKDMDLWKSFCESHQLSLFEDCAQAHGARWKQQAVGSFGEWGAYSFYPTKNLGAIGDGGALITQSKSIADQAKVLRNYGQTQRYYHDELGLNSRLDELQAAILLERISYWRQWTHDRQKLAQNYYQHIRNPKITLLSQPQNVENHVYHLFVVKTEYRQELMTHLKENGVTSLIHYPVPIHEQPPCQSIKPTEEALPQTKAFAEQCLSIPCHAHITSMEQEHIIQILNQF